MVHTIIAPKPIMQNLSDAIVLDEEREQLHRQMLSSVSHDLKTPLASIIGALEVFDRMKDKLPEEKKLALTQVALQEAYRLDNFITNILDMARFENSFVKPREERSEIRAILNDCLLRLSNRMQGVTINIETGEPIEILTDPVLLTRAICLVLDNAVKFGGMPPVITIKCARKDDQSAVITIHDNGAGIPLELREKIFSKYTRFVREDQQNAGTGLGLAITRIIMRLLRGGIDATNHSEGGACFILTVPLPK